MKKILIGAIVVVVLGLVLGGALVRTNDRLGTTSEASGGRGGGWGQSQTAITDWVTLNGVVTSVDEVTLTIKTENGSAVTVENRPWAYALEQKFAANVGDKVKVIGFNSGEYFETAQIQNLTTGKTIVLRDEYGRPGWSGRGRRSGG